VTKKALLILAIILAVCVACRSTEPAAPAPTATVLPTAAPDPTGTPLPSDTPVVEETIEPALDGRIVFYSERDGNAEIYTMNPDGSDPRRLTFNQFEDSAPAWSPDGSQIAFISDRDDPHPGACFPDCFTQIYVMDADGSDEHRLIESEFPMQHPDWHPDGTRLSFDSERDFQADIYVVNADGRGLQRLIEDGFWADWSPDGTQIAFASKRDGNVEIYVADADGRNQRRLTDNSRLDYFPAWSPDGRRIAFAALEQQRIYVMNADGSDEQPLADLARSEDPAWSPDGSHIVFQSSSTGNFEIYTVDVEDVLQGKADAGPRRLTDNHAGDFWPAWGPSPGAAAAESTASPVAAPLLEKSPQEFDARGTFQAGLGDLDGDGDLDAVFANPQTHDSGVWLNDGSGTLVDTGQQLTQYGHGVGLADFDGDGDLDAFIACHQFVTPSRLYLNDGTGVLTDSGQDLGDASISANQAYLVDVDGDGYVDVHVVYYDPGGMPDKVYLNDGHGTLADSGLALDEETIAWGDLDGDGDADYFGKRWGQGYVVQLNDGHGRFSPGWQMEDGASTVGGVALADLDGDGDLDALVANGYRSTGSVPSRLLWNDGRGRFGDSGQRLNGTLGAHLATGDLDGDGDLDVFVANMDLPNEVWLNDGGRLRDSGLRLGEVPPLGYSTEPSLGDLDGDGDLDVFVGSLSGRPEIWFNLAVPPAGR
jgi:Tol biopolymer transport system component